MTPEQVELVRTSFAKVMDIKIQAARMFYDRLFVIAPDVRPMFKEDLQEQSRKLMDTLAMAIASLRQSTVLNEMLDGLAARHVGYGVREEHYEKVGEALLWTLEQGLGPDFTPKVREAWVALYGAIASRMKGIPQVARA